MKEKNKSQHGWEFSAYVLGASVAASRGEEYVHAIEEVIKKLEDNINNHQYRKLGIAQLQGYMLEEYAAGTFNVAAVAAGSSDRASVLRSTVKDSIDIELKSGKTYSAKSYATPEQTARAQAQLNSETRHPRYEGQYRLIPADHLNGAKKTAHREMLSNSQSRPEVSESYGETEQMLTDKVTNNEGMESRVASRKQLEKIAKESQKQEFKAEKYDVTSASAIYPEYLVKQALKAGYTAAVITVATQLAPEIYKSIDFLIKNGELDLAQVKHLGERGISSGAEGFLKGAISSALQIMLDSGALGKASSEVNPVLLGTVVALVLQTAKNSVLVAAGKMTAQQMGSEFVDMVVVSGGYLVGSYLGGLIGQTLGFQLPVLGYLLGSLLGTTFSIVHSIGKQKLISFCVDTGFACFGLVEQNYELPESVLHELGIEMASIPRSSIDSAPLSKAVIKKAEIPQSPYETIDITFLRRGIIGINRVGYVI